MLMRPLTAPRSCGCGCRRAPGRPTIRSTGFERTFEDRVRDANDHYDAIIPARITGDARGSCDKRRPVCSGPSSSITTW